MKELKRKNENKKNSNNDSDGGADTQFLRVKGRKKIRERDEELERLQRRNAMLKSNLDDIHNESKKYNYEIYLPKVDKSKQKSEDDVDFDF